jgi:hypothetical protein
MSTREFFILFFNATKGQIEQQGGFREAASMVVVGCERKGNTATVKIRNRKTGRVAHGRVVKEGGLWKVDE